MWGIKGIKNDIKHHHIIMASNNTFNALKQNMVVNILAIGQTIAYRFMKLAYIKIH